MKYNTKLERVNRSKPEINSGEEKVSMIGFIPRHRQINTLIEAGKRLEALRGKYDVYDDNIDDVDVDPTRSKSFDLADASEFLNRMGIKDIDMENGTYTDHQGNVRRIFQNASAPENSVKIDAQDAQEGPDTASRSVSGQLTPEVENESSETKQTKKSKTVEKE